MKKVLLLLCLTAFLQKLNAQTTYYWVGGTGPTTFTGASRWNTALNGSGTQRTTADTTDILVIDGTNVGGANATTGLIKATTTSSKFGQLKLINGASLELSRPTGGGAGTLTITGGPGEDFVVDANSSYTVNSIVDSGSVVTVIQNGATGLVSGKVMLTNTATSRITVQAAGALVFDATATFTAATTPATSSYPFGSNTQGFEKGIVFLSGSKLISTGKYSPMGGTSTYMAIDFRSGSNYYIRSSNAASTGSWTANKIFGNLFIENGATLTCDGSIAKIENLTIDAGCTFLTHTSGQTPVIGNIVVNGTYSTQPATTTNVLVMGGNSLQTISGSAANISPAAFTVADNSNVILATNVVTTGTTSSAVFGKLNFTTKTLSGTSPFGARVNSSAGAVTGNTTLGSYIVTAVVGTLSGNTGLTVSGAGIAPNTNVLGFSTSNSTITLSQPATATGVAVALTFSSKSATLITANSNGFDSTNGSVTTTGLKSFTTGTNYIINAATNNPIGISSTATTGMTVGDLVVNAPITTNINTRINGTLTMNTGILSIRPSDTLRIFNGTDIAGAPFSNTKYIQTKANGSNIGVLRIDSISGSKVFPVGNDNYHLPVLVTPTDNSNICVSVTNQFTIDGSVSGTPASSIQKQRLVDANWIINRTKGTGLCDVSLNWVAAIEGSDFANFADNEIGMARYDAAATSWEIANARDANNTTNKVANDISNFGVYGVGRLTEVLPVKITNLTAIRKNNSTEINWISLNEINISKYIIERSFDGRLFNTIGYVEAKKIPSEVKYNFIDKNNNLSSSYYRIVAIENNGSKLYSYVVYVNNEQIAKPNIFPNPAKNNIYINNLTPMATIQVVNITGKVVKELVAKSQTETLNLETLSNGCWIIKIIQSNGNVSTNTFIKN